jgi:hypothetical protein
LRANIILDAKFNLEHWLLSYFFWHAKQNTINRVAYKQQKCTSHNSVIWVVQGPGVYKFDISNSPVSTSSHVLVMLKL